jgi:hypothetical protein
LTKERKKEKKVLLFFLPSFDPKKFSEEQFQVSAFNNKQTNNKRTHKKQLSAALVVHYSYIFKNDGRRRSATPRTRPSEEERTVGG